MRSPNDEGSQFSKLHFPCNKEERLVSNSFFGEYDLYLKKKKTLNLFKVAYHPVSCLLHLHTYTTTLHIDTSARKIHHSTTVNTTLIWKIYRLHEPRSQQKLKGTLVKPSPPTTSTTSELPPKKWSISKGGLYKHVY